MTDPSFLPAHLLSAMVRGGQIGALELTDHFIERIERLDPKINAVVVRDFDRARARARALDNEPARAGALFGVPMTVKESFDVAGLPTTWGVAEERNSIAKRDALGVQRLKDAGATIMGKTNVPLLLADWQSYNVIYGTTNNPWDLTRSPGGSSGGSAAALASGMTALEIGSDIGSSIRNPAHYCGVFGHKPSWGICPPLGQALRGTVSQADISVIGPLARSADDLAMALDAIAGPEEIEAAGWKLDLAPSRGTRFADLRVAVMTDHAVSEVDACITGRIEELASFLEKQGARVSRTARPDFDLAHAHRLYIMLLRATTSARLETAAIARWSEEAARHAPDDPSYIALMARGNSLLHRDFLRGNELRQRMRRAWAAFFREWDVFLCPAAASPGPAARPCGRALGPHDRGERPSRADDRSDVLGGYFRASFCCPPPSRRLAFHLRACRSGCRSSGRNTAIARRSPSPACCNPRGRGSRRLRLTDRTSLMNPTFQPAWRLAELTRSGEISCLELLDHFIAREERLNPRLNAVVARDLERARARARSLDKSRGDNAPPLFGVPMTVKESFDVTGLPTTWGFEDRRVHRAESDALAVQRMEDAGVVVFGKTNVPVALADWQSLQPGVRHHA